MFVPRDSAPVGRSDEAPGTPAAHASAAHRRAHVGRPPTADAALLEIETSLRIGRRALRWGFDFVKCPTPAVRAEVLEVQEAPRVTSASPGSTSSSPISSPMRWSAWPRTRAAPGEIDAVASHGQTKGPSRADAPLAEAGAAEGFAPARRRRGSCRRRLIRRPPPRSGSRRCWWNARVFRW
jgi:hypothetical protein